MAAGSWGNPPICTAHFPGESAAAADCISSTFTSATPGCQTSSLRAAARERSRMRPGMNGPRSVMRTSARSACLHIGHAHDRAQRVGAVRSRHGVHVVDFAIGSATVVIGRAVPTGKSSFRSERLGAGRDRGLGEVGAPFRLLLCPGIGGWFFCRSRSLAEGRLRWAPSSTPGAEVAERSRAPVWDDHSHQQRIVRRRIRSMARLTTWRDDRARLVIECPNELFRWVVLLLHVVGKFGSAFEKPLAVPWWSACEPPARLRR